MITFEGIDFISTPLCEVISHTEEPCYGSSVVRMQTQCDDCGHRVIRFFCRGHYKGLTAKQVACYHCKSGNIETRVS